MDKVNAVYKTTNYDCFKFLVGNRSVEEERKEKIRSSIKKVGLIPNPILCNENMEIIDGQARYLVCRELELPIYFVVEHGIGINECIAMNVNQKAWKTMDYVSSYANRGNINFIRLKRFLCSNNKYNLNLKLWAMFRTSATNKLKDIKEGNIIISDQNLRDAYDMLAFFDNFYGIKTNRQTEFYMAIGYCYIFPEVDNRILIKKLENSRAFVNIANVRDAISVIEDEYNKRLRDHVYIETIYLKCLEKSGVASLHTRRNNNENI